MHARLQVRLLNRSLALGVCESMETMAVPSPKRRKSRADRALVVIGWGVVAVFFGLVLAGAR